MVKELYKRKFVLPEEAKRIILECSLFLLALFLTPVKFIFGTLPFGFVLCASAKKDAPFAFAGALASCVFFVEDTGVYIIAFISLFILRTLCAFIKKPQSEKREKYGASLPHLLSELFCENIFLRVLISLACAFGVGIYYTALGGYMLYDVFALIFFVVSCPLLTFLASGAWEVHRLREFYVGLAILGFMIAFGARGILVGGFDFSVFISFAVVLYVTRATSTAWGAVLGALFSLCLEPRFALSLVLCALVFGILCNLSNLLAIICAIILSISYAIWAGGYDAYTCVVPELVGAGVLIFPILQLNLLSFLKIRCLANGKTDTFTKDAELKEVKREAFYTSRAFYDVSKILQNTQRECKSTTLEGFEADARRQMLKLCASCPKEEICWSRDNETTQRAFSSICENAYFFGNSQKSCLDEKFLHRCPSVEKITEEAAKLSFDNLENGIKNDKLEISACAFELCARIIGAKETKNARFERDEAKSKKAEKALIKHDLSFEGCEILGTKSISVFISGIDTARSKIPISKIPSILSRALDVELDEPTIEEENGLCNVWISALPTLKASYSKRSVSKESGSNGDALCAFLGGERSFYLISDGMGTGKSASLTSNMCVSFLEAMLPITDDTELCLGALNSFVRAKGGELSSSIDLLQVDNFTKEATFYKSGACPSLIKRGERVFCVASKTAPIGIMKRLDCERLSFTFESGDIAVMISDGALSGKGDFSYVEELLKDSCEAEPTLLSEEIVNKFLESNEQVDDLSVFVIRFD